MRFLKESALSLVLFSIFTNDLEDGAECIFSRFADGTKMIGVTDILGDRIRIQYDLG